MDDKDNATTERKIISVTGKRQITIPLRFYKKLRFGNEVECILTDNAIVLRPFSASDDNFTLEILKDLISQGYSGEQLLAKFTEQRLKIKKALNNLLEEADEIAAGTRVGVTTKDIFGEE